MSISVKDDIFVDGKRVLHSGDILDGTIGRDHVANTTITYTGDLVTKITEDGVDTVITYNADSTVNTIVFPRGGRVRTETYSYANGRVIGMTGVEV